MSETGPALAHSPVCVTVILKAARLKKKKKKLTPYFSDRRTNISMIVRVITVCMFFQLVAPKRLQTPHKGFFLSSSVLRFMNGMLLNSLYI